jgi:hypothetical protein
MSSTVFLKSLWAAQTISPNTYANAATPVNGVAVDTKPFRLDAIGFIITVGPGLTAPVTFSFFGAPENPAVPGTPLMSAAVQLLDGGLCDPFTPALWTVDPSAVGSNYLLHGYDNNLVVVQACPNDYVWAVANAAGAYAVDVVGEARQTIAGQNQGAGGTIRSTVY